MKKEFISVLALFDEEGAFKLKYYHNLIASERKNPDYLPHMTLAVYDKPINIEEVKSWVYDFSLSHQEFLINLMSVGIFNDSNIFALPGISYDLQNFYKDFHQKFASECRMFFSPNSIEWFPHIGLYYTDVHNAKLRFPILIEDFDVTQLMINRLRITKKTSDGYIVISEFPLNK